ncbi:MAG: hypothetical protein ACKOGP_02855 [Bacteroidota bacterium]
MTKTAVFAMILMACSLIGLLIYRILPNQYGLFISILFAVAGIATGLSKPNNSSGKEPEWRSNPADMFRWKKNKRRKGSSEK